MTVTAGPFEFTLDEGLTYEAFETPYYFGVVFKAADGHRYEVICSVLGWRVLINDETRPGFFRDMPFHEGTFGFLVGVSTRRVR